MPLTTADLDAVQSRAYKANSQYAIHFWVAPTRTGTALINLVRSMKLQLDRIENDTDQLAISRELVDVLDTNLSALAKAQQGNDGTQGA